MAGPRQPVALIEAKGKKHLTKAEIEARRASEVQPIADDLTAPSFLTAAQKKRFAKLAEQLDKIKIMGETDTETLARYVVAQDMYEKTVREMRRLEKDMPDQDSEDYFARLDLWYKLQENLDKRLDRYFKQATAAAKELGLTISSRCRLVVPVQEQKEKVNKFDKFVALPGGKGAAVND